MESVEQVRERSEKLHGYYRSNAWWFDLSKDNKSTKDGGILYNENRNDSLVVATEYHHIGFWKLVGWMASK